MNHSGDLGESKLTYQMNAAHKEEGGVAFKATQLLVKKYVLLKNTMMNNDLPRHSHCSENIKNSSFLKEYLGPRR